MEPMAANGRNDVESGSALPPAARIAMLVVAALAVLAWLFLAFAHLHDRFNVNHVSGTLLALADRAREGVLYPPFFDGQSYGGTRAMPVPILLYAVAISIGGDLLAPAKLVDLLASAALVAVLVAVLRRRGASMTVSVGLAATVVTSQVFLLAGAGIRPEALPTAAAAERGRARRIRPAACGVGARSDPVRCRPVREAQRALGADRHRRLAAHKGSRSTGIVLHHPRRGHRRPGAVFTVASDGRMLTNLLGLGGAGLSLGGVVKAPLKAVDLLLQYALASLVLLPALVLGLFFAGRESRPTIFQAALVAAGGDPARRDG